MKSWSQLILQKVPDKISASQFLLVLLTLDSNLYHIFYTISFYTIIVQKNRTLFHKLFPPLSHRNVALSFFPFILASSLMQCYSIVNNFSGGNTMIDKKLIPVKGLKKEPFSGSHFGMRYYFCADDTKENFLVFVYPEPWSFEKTPDEQKTQKTFPITEDGMDAAISWLLEQYDARRDFWNSVSKNTMHFVNQTS